jgi:hypothetical protein
MGTKPGDPFERAGRRKKLIEMERRHIREGEARVARQEEIVSQLDLSGAHEHVLTARALLVTFRDFVVSAIRISRNWSGNNPTNRPRQTRPRR